MFQRSVGEQQRKGNLQLERGEEEEKGEDDMSYAETLDTLRRDVLFKPRPPEPPN